MKVQSGEMQCPRGCVSVNYGGEGSVMCGSCGLVLKSEEFEAEFQGGFQHPERSYGRRVKYNGSGNSNNSCAENRQREITRQLSEFCTLYSLNICEREEVSHIVESILQVMDNKQKKCRSLKSLIAASLYEHAKRTKKSIPINQLCRHFLIKQSKLLKYLKKINKYSFQMNENNYTEDINRHMGLNVICANNIGSNVSHSERIRNEWEEVMSSLSDKLRGMLVIGCAQNKYASTFAPNEFLNQEKAGSSCMLFKKQLREIEESGVDGQLQKVKSLVHSLYHCEYLSITRMGKHPYNYICTLVYLILKSMNVNFKNNKFCDTIGIKYSTLSREKKQITVQLLSSLFSLNTNYNHLNQQQQKIPNISLLSAIPSIQKDLSFFNNQNLAQLKPFDNSSYNIQQLSNQDQSLFQKPTLQINQIKDNQQFNQDNMLTPQGLFFRLEDKILSSPNQSHSQFQKPTVQINSIKNVIYNQENLFSPQSLFFRFEEKILSSSNETHSLHQKPTLQMNSIKETKQFNQENMFSPQSLFFGLEDKILKSSMTHSSFLCNDNFSSNQKSTLKQQGISQGFSQIDSQHKNNCLNLEYIEMLPGHLTKEINELQVKYPSLKTEQQIANVNIKMSSELIAFALKYVIAISADQQVDSLTASNCLKSKENDTPLIDPILSLVQNSNILKVEQHDIHSQLDNSFSFDSTPSSPQLKTIQNNHLVSPTSQS